jgi:hypothetical protein
VPRHGAGDPGAPAVRRAFAERSTLASRGGRSTTPPAARRAERHSLGVSNQAAQAEIDGVPQAVRAALSSPGWPLASNLRAYFEPRFGRDFGDVRVSDDATARKSAAAIGAAAYSFGNRIMLAGPAAENPAVLAHELAHVTQQRGFAGTPQGIERADAPAEAEARAAPGLLARGVIPAVTPGTARPGLIHRQPAVPNQGVKDQAPPSQASQAPQNQTPQNQAPSPPPKQPETQPAPGPTTLKQRVNDILDRNSFDVPLIRDGVHAFYQNNRHTLDEITDYVTELIPGAKRSDVWSEVWQAYGAKEQKADSGIQVVIQALYTPAYIFRATQPQALGWQQGAQISVGLNLPRHDPGFRGVEHTLQLSGSLANLDFGSEGWFQNALASYQFSYVLPFQPEYKIDDSSWAPWLQGSVFGQIAAGVGTNQDPTDRKVYYGLMLQPSAGGQITLNIWKLQVIAQGALVYSWLSPTNQPGSQPTSTLGGQFGLGLGGQF